MLRSQNQELREGIRSLYNHYQSGQALPNWFPRGLGDDSPAVHDIVTSAKRLETNTRMIRSHQDQRSDPLMAMDQVRYDLPPDNLSSPGRMPYVIQSGMGSLDGSLQHVQSDTNCTQTVSTAFDIDPSHCSRLNTKSYLQAWHAAELSSVPPYSQTVLTGASPSSPYVICL